MPPPGKAMQENLNGFIIIIFVIAMFVIFILLL